MPVAKGRRQRVLGRSDPRAPAGRMRHGLTAAEIEALKRRQGHACAICLTPDTGGDTALEIDHDHRHHPGREGCRLCVRGAVCGRCNRALSWFDRHVDRLLIYSRRA